MPREDEIRNAISRSGIAENLVSTLNKYQNRMLAFFDAFGNHHGVSGRLFFNIDFSDGKQPLTISSNLTIDPEVVNAFAKATKQFKAISTSDANDPILQERFNEIMSVVLDEIERNPYWQKFWNSEAQVWLDHKQEIYNKVLGAVGYKIALTCINDAKFESAFTPNARGGLAGLATKVCNNHESANYAAVVQMNYASLLVPESPAVSTASTNDCESSSSSSSAPPSPEQTLSTPTSPAATSTNPAVTAPASPRVSAKKPGGFISAITDFARRAKPTSRLSRSTEIGAVSATQLPPLNSISPTASPRGIASEPTSPLPIPATVTASATTTALSPRLAKSPIMTIKAPAVKAPVPNEMQSATRRRRPSTVGSTPRRIKREDSDLETLFTPREIPRAIAAAKSEKVLGSSTASAIFALKKPIRFNTNVSTKADRGEMVDEPPTVAAVLRTAAAPVSISPARLRIQSNSTTTRREQTELKPDAPQSVESPRLGRSSGLADSPRRSRANALVESPQRGRSAVLTESPRRGLASELVKSPRLDRSTALAESPRLSRAASQSVGLESTPAIMRATSIGTNLATSVSAPALTSTAKLRKAGSANKGVTAEEKLKAEDKQKEKLAKIEQIRLSRQKAEAAGASVSTSDSSSATNSPRSSRTSDSETDPGKGSSSPSVRSKSNR